MSQEIWAGRMGELRAASAQAGLACTTTAGFVEIPDGAQHLVLDALNFATAKVIGVALNPYLLVMLTTDNLATVTDASQAVQDGSTATFLTLNSFNTAAATNYIYVGSHLPFRGVRVLVGNTNSTASVLTVNYWNGSAWTDTSATDGTINTGATFGQNGNVTWTVPTAWVKTSLATIATPAPAAGVAHRLEPMYWTRWQASVQFDASVTATSFISMGRSTNYWNLTSGRMLELSITKGPGGVANVEAATDAGTGNLVVNVASRFGTAFV